MKFECYFQTYLFIILLCFSFVVHISFYNDVKCPCQIQLVSVGFQIHTESLIILAYHTLKLSIFNHTIIDIFNHH